MCLLRVFPSCRRVQPPDQLQLWKEEVVLEDAKKLADLKVENDDIVVMCYQDAGGGVFVFPEGSGKRQRSGMLVLGWSSVGGALCWCVGFLVQCQVLTPCLCGVLLCRWRLGDERGNPVRCST